MTTCATARLFAALDIIAGKVIGQCFARHRSREFLKLPRPLPHGRCHQGAFGVMLALERTLRPVPQLEVDTVESSCRGMAGAFRYEAANDETAMATGGPDLPPAARTADRNVFIVAGGSRCRHRIADGTARLARHPADVPGKALP